MTVLSPTGTILQIYLRCFRKISFLIISSDCFSYDRLSSLPLAFSTLRVSSSRITAPLEPNILLLGLCNHILLFNFFYITNNILNNIHIIFHFHFYNNSLFLIINIYASIADRLLIIFINYLFPIDIYLVIFR